MLKPKLVVSYEKKKKNIGAGSQPSDLIADFKEKITELSTI